MQYDSSTLSIALITVALEPETADEIADSLTLMSWIVTRADCDGYISAERRPPFTQQVKSATACIAVIDFDKDIDRAIEAASYINQMFNGKVALVARSSSQDPDILLRAMRAGCTEFIGQHFDEVAFSQTLTRLFRQWSSAPVRGLASGSVISFIGVKGGVGTTTLAVHFAMYLVQCHKKRVLLIDNHPQLGHACVYLGLDGSRYHFNELVRNLNRLDSDLLRGYIATHSSGLEVLSSPDTCSGAKATEPESISQTLDFLRGEYDFVIVDCSTTLDDTNHSVIDSSNFVYLVATPEIGAIRDLSRFVDNLSQSTHTVEKMHVVINRFSSQHAVNVEQIEKAIRLPVAIKLPNSYAELVRSAILGEPVTAKQKTEFANLVVKWTSNVVGSSAIADPEPAKKSIFSFLSK